MSAPSGEWVRLSDYEFASPIAQSLTAVTIWPTLTPKQRELLASCRELRDPNAEWPNKYAVIIDRLTDQPKVTLKSLERKGVVDEYGRLTIPGIYTALWNQLDRDRARQAAKGEL